MPFPFAAIGAAIAGLGTLGTIAAGAAVVAGGVLTAAAISVHNDEKRAKARREAEAAASRERERQLLAEKRRSDEEKRKLEAEYGDSIPKEKAEAFWSQRFEICGGLEGNDIGLGKKGETSSKAAQDALKELQAEFKAAGVTE